MADIKVAVINASKAVRNRDAAAVVPRLQTQVTRDFAPVWGVPADLVFVKKGQRPPPGTWWLVILDDSDDAGALGYHDMTDEGQPLGKVFARTDRVYGLQWSVTASHELLEMLADPAINLTALVQTPFDPAENVVGRAYAYEICDPCEADRDGYEIEGTWVSDFVYPAWFEPFRKKGSTRFDQRGLLKAPFTLRVDGYMQVYDLSSGTGWQQVVAEGRHSYAARPRVGSRRERRRTPRNAWMRSTPRDR